MRNINYKIAMVCCGLLLAGTMQAQIGTWKSYMAYFQATIVTETPNLVFGVYDGSLLSYRPEDGEIRTYSNQNGLHDTNILQMAYHPGAKALILVYNNANIDLFYGDNDVYPITSIKDYPYIQDKTIYNLEIIGDYAYLSTAFGIVVLDVNRKEIKDTYRLGIAVRSVCQNGNYLYAATSDGVKKALMTSNLLDRENWTPADEAPATPGDITQLLFFQGQMVYVSGDTVYYVTPDGKATSLGLNNVRYMKLLNGQLVVLTDSNVYFYSGFTTFTQVPLSAYYVDCINTGNQYWLASGEDGLTGFTKLPTTSDYTLTVSGIKANSPKRNLNFYMTFQSNKLLITGGGKSSDRLYIPGTLMVYENGQWYNYDENAVSAKTGLPCLDFVSVTVDPSDPMHYFVGSWGEGLYEFRNNEFVNLYSIANSSLLSAIAGSNRYVRVDGLVFDANNNLYMVNGGVSNGGLTIFLNQQDWKTFNNYPPLISSDPDRILISNINQKWFNFFRGARTGIMVLDENGTVGDPSDDQYAYSGHFVDQQGSDVSATVYLAMAEDQTGLIWVGTDYGPIFFSSADQVNSGVCSRIISVDANGNGYLALEGIKITSIAVDGGNRKWLGSAGSGVFVIDQSKGSETTIENFTTDNSYLLSNSINSIAINNATGEVFIGTDKGLCSYQSEAIEGKPNYSSVYAFPNPVRPDRNSQVVITGLMANSTVKITDLAGNLIQTGASMGGQYRWNCANRNGILVKAGIYLVFASTPEGNQGVVTKIMVIR